MILPSIMPALLTGFALAFARAIGEYGSVIFIAGNMPMITEITPLIIITKLEQYDYAGATAIALVMLVHLVRCCCWSINVLQAWQRRASGALGMSAPRSDQAVRRAQAGTHRAGLGALDADRPRRWPSCACSWCCRWPRCSTEALRKGVGAYLDALKRARCAGAPSG